MRRKFTIPLSYNPIDHQELAKVLDGYSDRHHDELITDFEAQLRDLTGSPYVVALNSGTSAIHLGLNALDVGVGDVVIASTFTYVATINPILYLQAVPVFVDSEMGTWNMDPDLLEQAIQHCIDEGKKPKAIIVVYTYGMPAQLDRILAIASHFEIPVLEDAAEAIGSTFLNKQLGSLGEIGVLSFNNNKILTTYGGGALLTSNRSIFEKVQHWSTQSRENLPYYQHAELGFNYRMGPLNAAMGIVQMGSIKSKVENKRRVFQNYQEAFGNSSGITWQSEPLESKSNRWITGLVLNSGQERIRKDLDVAGIETRPLWKPMHVQPLFKSFKSFLNNSSALLFKNGFCLPSGDELTKSQIEVVSEIVLRTT